MNGLLLFFLTLVMAPFSACDNAASQSHPAPPVQAQAAVSLRSVSDIAPPEGYERRPTEEGSFTAYLRSLPLKTANDSVMLFNGQPKVNQKAQYKVLAVDVGTTDLQQCADAVMRLRAEYLWQQKRYRDIHFNFTSGDTARYAMWREGWRPSVNGNTVQWRRSSKPDTSYRNFRNFLNVVFTYAGSHSLQKELRSVPNQDVSPGDVWIEGGFPGHAIVVLDVCYEKTTGAPLMLLAQSYMPAQEIHILRNPSKPGLSPWYSLPKTKGNLRTPEWTFGGDRLMRWK